MRLWFSFWLQLMCWVLSSGHPHTFTSPIIGKLIFHNISDSQDQNNEESFRNQCFPLRSFNGLEVGIVGISNEVVFENECSRINKLKNRKVQLYSLGLVPRNKGLLFRAQKDHEVLRPVLCDIELVNDSKDGILFEEIIAFGRPSWGSTAYLMKLFDRESNLQSGSVSENDDELNASPMSVDLLCLLQSVGRISLKTNHWLVGTAALEVSFPNMLEVLASIGDPLITGYNSRPQLGTTSYLTSGITVKQPILNSRTRVSRSDASYDFHLTASWGLGVVPSHLQVSGDIAVKRIPDSGYPTCHNNRSFIFHDWPLCLTNDFAAMRIPQGRLPASFSIPSLRGALKRMNTWNRFVDVVEVPTAQPQKVFDNVIGRCDVLFPIPLHVVDISISLSFEINFIDTTYRKSLLNQRNISFNEVSQNQYDLWLFSALNDNRVSNANSDGFIFETLEEFMTSNRVYKKKVRAKMCEVLHDKVIKRSSGISGVNISEDALLHCRIRSDTLPDPSSELHIVLVQKDPSIDFTKLKTHLAIENVELIGQPKNHIHKLDNHVQEEHQGFNTQAPNIPNPYPARNAVSETQRCDVDELRECTGSSDLVNCLKASGARDSICLCLQHALWCFQDHQSGCPGKEALAQMAIQNSCDISEEAWMESTENDKREPRVVEDSLVAMVTNAKVDPSKAR